MLDEKNTKELLLKFIEPRIKDLLSEKPKALLEVLSGLRELIQTEEEKFTEIKQAFETINARGSNLNFISCPDCGSPVLLEYGNCNLCGTPLIDTGEGEEKETEVVKKPTEKKVEVITASNVTEKPEEEKIDNTEDEEEAPSEEEINKMGIKKLKEIIKEYDLGIKTSKIKKVADLRKAVNDAFDEMVEEDDSEEDVQETSNNNDDEPTEVNPADFDLDSDDEPDDDESSDSEETKELDLDEDEDFNLDDLGLDELDGVDDLLNEDDEDEDL